MNDKEHDYVFKCIIIGDSHVGKTTLLRTYVDHGVFSTDTGRAIYVNPNPNARSKKTLAIGQASVSLEIHDTMGQERFRSLTRSYYRGAHGCLVCFDVNSSTSFDSLTTWMSDVSECLDSENTVITMLVGIVRPHRADSASIPYRTGSVDSCPRVCKQRAEDFADKHNMRYMELQLTDFQQVNTCFSKLVELMIYARQRSSSKIKSESGLGASISLESSIDAKRWTCPC